MQQQWKDVPELIVGRLEGGCNGDVEEEGEEEMHEPSFDHHQLPNFSCTTTSSLMRQLELKVTTNGWALEKGHEGGLDHDFVQSSYHPP